MSISDYTSKKWKETLGRQGTTVCQDFSSLYPRLRLIRSFNMGTNYYLRRILTKEDQMVLGYRVMNADKAFNGDAMKSTLDNIKAVVDELEQFLKPRHLGKLSAGWEFCFRSNPDLYGDSLEEACRYLSEMTSQKKAAIFSEYGEEVTPEQFRDKILSHAGQQNFQRNNEPDDPYEPRKINGVGFSTREWLSDKDGTWWYDGEFR